MPNYNIALLKGDGIGPDIINEAVKVLNDVGTLFGHTFTYTEVIAGGVAIDEFGVPLPDSELKKCLDSDSVLLGAVGGPKWDTLPGDMRPERALLGIRSALGLYANIRPAVLYPALKDACPLKESISGDGFDFVVVRELTGGLYYGSRGRIQTENGVAAYDTMIYNEREVERIGRTAFELAESRERKILTNVDKANVLESSRLWREVMHRIKGDYPTVEYSDMLVDNAAMQLVKNPGQFDVIVTENTFGDILSDEAGMITGSIGMLASASLGEGSRGLYEPIHGSAPDIAGKDLANPIATILSTAMMLRMSFGLTAEADAIERAVASVLEDGLRTADIGGGANSLGTVAMGAAIRSRLTR